MKKFIKKIKDKIKVAEKKKNKDKIKAIKVVEEKKIKDKFKKNAKTIEIFISEDVTMTGEITINKLK